LRRFASRGLPPPNYLGRWSPQPPVWKEVRGPWEYVQLLRDPVFMGDGVPRGGGRPVLLIPGFMAGDSSLLTLRYWLRRLGYDTEDVGLWFNIRYSEVVLTQLASHLDRLHARGQGQKVTVVGHSRGGILAKVLAERRPEVVARVIALGSPLGDPYDLHPITAAGVRLAHLYNLARYLRTAAVEHRFLRDLAAPARVPLVSIYSPTDGIVHWKACLRPDAECIEVEGSHVGLTNNRDVYRHLARILPTRAKRRRIPGAGPSLPELLTS
jgi:triacylglycerol lipase